MPEEHEPGAPVDEKTWALTRRSWFPHSYVLSPPEWLKQKSQGPCKQARAAFPPAFAFSRYWSLGSFPKYFVCYHGSGWTQLTGSALQLVYQCGGGWGGL